MIKIVRLKPDLRVGACTDNGIEVRYDDVLIFEQGAFAFTDKGEGGVVGGQVVVLGAEESGVFFDGVEVTVGRDPAFVSIRHALRFEPLFSRFSQASGLCVGLVFGLDLAEGSVQ